MELHRPRFLKNPTEGIKQHLRDAAAALRRERAEPAETDYQRLVREIRNALDKIMRWRDNSLLLEQDIVQQFSRTGDIMAPSLSEVAQFRKFMDDWLGILHEVIVMVRDAARRYVEEASAERRTELASRIRTFNEVHRVFQGQIDPTFFYLDDLRLRGRFDGPQTLLQRQEEEVKRIILRIENLTAKEVLPFMRYLENLAWTIVYNGH